MLPFIIGIALLLIGAISTYAARQRTESLVEFRSLRRSLLLAGQGAAQQSPEEPGKPQEDQLAVTAKTLRGAATTEERSRYGDLVEWSIDVALALTTALTPVIGFVTAPYLHMSTDAFQLMYSVAILFGIGLFVYSLFYPNPSRYRRLLKPIPVSFVTTVGIALNVIFLLIAWMLV
jgi:hypothetical protein